MSQNERENETSCEIKSSSSTAAQYGENSHVAIKAQSHVTPLLYQLAFPLCFVRIQV